MWHLVVRAEASETVCLVARVKEVAGAHLIVRARLKERTWLLIRAGHKKKVLGKAS